MTLLLLFFCIIPIHTLDIDGFYNSFEEPMYDDERRYLREKTKSMFLHSHYAYKKICNVTCDYVNPISCQPVYYEKNAQSDNYEFLGNFSVSLLESLDTMALMGLYDEFYDAVKKIISHLNFNVDVVASAFELNIRLLGGLLTAHDFIYKIEPLRSKFTNYKDELLTLAKDLGDRLLLAFTEAPYNIPYKKIHLNNARPDLSANVTTTADAGSFLLEFCTLSRLTHNSTYCNTALSIMDTLWEMKSNKTKLPYQYIDVEKGDWHSGSATIGSGVDSYFEYLMKGYIMTGNATLYERFVEHYASIEKHLKIKHAYGTSDENNSNILSHIDAFQAFWPSVQILHGDFKNGLNFYYTLFKALSSHVLLPETISPINLGIINPSFKLRPEFIESTYYLYKATRDPFFLNVGKFVLYSTENYCRSQCGYSTLRNIRGTKDDQTRSFFVSEYLKYLYLLFSIDDDDLPVNLDHYVFNTEGHPLPILDMEERRLFNNWRQDPIYTCSTNSYYCNIENIWRDRHKTLKEIEKHTNVSKTSFSQFQFYYFDAKDHTHMQTLTRNNITYHNDKNSQIFTLNLDLDEPNSDAIGKIMHDLSHKIINYKSKKMEMEKPAFIKLPSATVGGNQFMVQVGVAFFGRPINKFLAPVEGQLSKAEPFDACTKLTNSEEISGKIVLASRGNCNFVVKARNIQRSGGIAAYVLNNQPMNDVVIHMVSDDYHNDILIPSVFLSLMDAKNKDISNMYKKILLSSNEELQSSKSIIFPTDLAINIVFN